MMAFSASKSGASPLKQRSADYKAGNLIFILPYNSQNISQIFLPLLQKLPNRWMFVHLQLHPETEYY
jgi:hypothetical protein